MKRLTLYSLIIVVVLAAATLWYLPAHTWMSQSMDGASGGGFGPSGRGVGFSTTTWNSVSGVSVDELVIHYSSKNDARADFDLKLKEGGTVVQRTDDTGADRQRAVMVFGNPNYGTSEIVTRNGQQLTFIKAGTLKYVLTFENSILKF